MAVKVLLDTDIGSDIDDAVCLAYLLANPACDLVGITTVTGEPETRAMMASAMCRVAGRKIPIFPGCAHPFLVAQKQPQVPQASALPRWPHDTAFPRGQAVEFMRQAIRAAPGEIILLAIGPLTNVAALFMADAEIPSLLKGLVLMNGVFGDRPPGRTAIEWNTLLDPVASALVYGAPVRSFRVVGLDVTEQVTLPAQEVRRRFQTPLLRPALDFAEVWFAQRDVITFHDPLAAATIFDDTICGFTRGRVEAVWRDGQAAGKTQWTADSCGPHEVALSVDAPRFFDHYFGVF
jgi:inosine-uridine nucleoside N-ribohydrolase